MPIDRTVSRLSVTPVKGLLLHHPDSIDLTAQGAVGDRQFYLVDHTGKIQSCTHNPGLTGLVATYDPESRRLQVTRGDQVLLAGIIEPATAVATDMWGLRTITSDIVADPVWSTFFSDIVGRRVHLVQARESAYDVRPATLLGTSSVEELARGAGLSNVDSRRLLPHQACDALPRALMDCHCGEPLQRCEGCGQPRRPDGRNRVTRCGCI